MKRGASALLLGLAICAVFASSVFLRAEGHQLPTATHEPAQDGAAPAATPMPTDGICTISFSDVPSSAPYYEAVRYAASHDMMQGMGDGTFDPDSPVSRGAVVSVLFRLSGESAPAYTGQFSDVAAESWYASAVSWASANGIVTGADGQFSPHKNMTRAELAAVLYRVSAHLGYPTAALSEGLQGYQDGPLVSEFAAEPLSWALGNGIFGAMVSDTIYPNLSVSRAQLAGALVCLVSHGTGEDEARAIAAQSSIVKTISAPGVMITVRPDSASLASHEELQALVEHTAQTYGAMGVQVAVVEHGAVTDTYACGWATKNSDPMTARHRMRVASISKVGIGLGAMALREDGVIDPDTGIGVYWGCDIASPYYPDIPISIRSILSHTSSIAIADSSTKHDAVQRKLSGKSGYNGGVPGSMSTWGYNNYGFAVLGLTLELAAGRTMDDILGERYFVPMEIDAAFEAGSVQRTDLLATLYESGGSVSRSVSSQKSLTCPPAGTTGQFFAGGLTISAADLGKLVALLAGDGRFEGVQVLSPESVQFMETLCETPAPDGFYQGLPLRYQTDLCGRDSLYYHTGSAYGVFNCISYDPETGDGVVVLTTGASGVKDDRGIYAVCGEISTGVYAVLSKAE